ASERAAWDRGHGERARPWADAERLPEARGDGRLATGARPDRRREVGGGDWLPRNDDRQDHRDPGVDQQTDPLGGPHLTARRRHQSGTPDAGARPDLIALSPSGGSWP